MTLIVAHRGASRSEPENTIAAFRRAAEMGADGVELDVRRTADDRLVVHHDPVVDDGRVIVDTVAADLPPSIPGFAAALDACDGMFVNIEIKNDPDEPDDDPGDRVAHQVADELSRRGPTARWLVSSFRLETVDLMRTLLPSIRTAWLVTGSSDERIDRTSAHGHAAIHPQVDRLGRASVRRAHALGLAVNVWTCDDPDRMRELIAWGVDGICTNVPDVAIAVRNGSG